MKNEKHLLPGACTCMTLTSNTGKHYWFRTCDIETNLWKEGAHVVQYPTQTNIKYQNGVEETTKYAILGVTYNKQKTWLLDGVNECGLVGGLLMLYEGIGVDKPDQGKVGCVGMEFITKILATCKDVKAVIEMAKKVQILNIPYQSMLIPATMHYFFVDSSGEEVILEATDRETPGILKIYSHKEILGVMTNSPTYDKQLDNLAWFLSQSPEMKQGIQGQAILELQLDKRIIKADDEAEHCSFNGTFPASYSSYDRFIRIAVMKALNQSGNKFEDDKMLALGSNLMNVVWEPGNQGLFHYTKIEEDGTILGQKNSSSQYMVMYNCEQKNFYIRPFDAVSWIKYEIIR